MLTRGSEQVSGGGASRKMLHVGRRYVDCFNSVELSLISCLFVKLDFRGLALNVHLKVDRRWVAFLLASTWLGLIKYQMQVEMERDRASPFLVGAFAKGPPWCSGGDDSLDR
jgi:hypothetical protein